ncbi:MAG TPA: WG repeat-containing protein, partial [Adhaeribacter sp.]|nr:WG repeat-containing protein [Adhaeribacter sp.]
MIIRITTSILLFLILGLLQLLSAFGQQQDKSTLSLKLPALIPYRAGDLWGYADSTGKIKVQPKYQFAEPFEDRVARVAVKHTWGLLNEKGKEIIPPRYQSIDPFSGGLAVVSNSSSERGVITSQGKEIVPVVYQYISFEKLPDSQIPMIRVSIEKPLSMAERQTTYKRTTKSVYGLYNSEGKRILSVAFDEITFLNGGLISACNQKECTVIKPDGTVILPLQEQKTGMVSEGLMILCKDRKCGFTDLTGRIIIPLKFDGVRDFSEGLAGAYVNGNWGFIDKTGKMQIAPAYSMIENFRDGLAVVSKGTAYGVIDKKGNEVLEFAYDRIHYNAHDKRYNLMAKNRNSYATFDPAKNKLSPQSDYYQHVGYQDGLAVAMKEPNQKGYVNQAGKIVIPMEYEEARPFYKGLAAVRKNWLWGVIDKEGKTVVPFAFAELEVVDANVFKIGIRSGPVGPTLYGLINREG